MGYPKGLSRNLPRISLGQEVIHNVDNYKYLGIILDNKLNFEKHAKSVYMQLRVT